MKKRLVGMRNFKTALCVLVCMSFTALFNVLADFVSSEAREIYNLLFVRDTALYSCIAAVISLQTTLSLTRKTGILRVVGTVLGGIFSVIILYINSYFNSDVFSFLLIFSGVIMLISFCSYIGQGKYASVSVVMFLIVVFGADEMSPYVAAVHRIIDTFGGAAVALGVNRFVFPPQD